MAALAQGLPISLIPEQLWVAAMWDYMVNHGRWLQLAIGEALDT